nr:hypothetical protein [Salipiger mangrovisoli]
MADHASAFNPDHSMGSPRLFVLGSHDFGTHLELAAVFGVLDDLHPLAAFPEAPFSISGVWDIGPPLLHVVVVSVHSPTGEVFHRQGLVLNEGSANGRFIMQGHQSQVADHCDQEECQQCLRSDDP